MTKFLNISTDNTLGGNSPSDSTVVSQKAIKGYVDGVTSAIQPQLNNKISYNTIIQNLNSFNNNGKLFLSTIDNCFYSLNRRFTVSGTGFTSFNAAALFDGVFENYSYNNIDVGETGVVTVTGTAITGTYRQGYILISFYSGRGPKAASDVTIQIENANGNVATLTPTAYSTNGLVLIAEVPTLPTANAISKITFTFVNNRTSGTVNPVELEYFCARPSNTGLLSYVSKTGNSTIYGNLTADSFVKSGGTSSQFLKADGSTDSNTYATTAQLPTVNDGTITVTQNGVSVGSFTLNQASGDTIALTDTTYSVMTGASAGDAGTSGLVPAPAAGDQAKFLQGDGTWANPTAATAWGNITGTLGDQTDLQNALDSKANTSLSNLTSVGQNISNWSTNVTNCITNIPQDIKLELNNGTLTLKAGSKVYVPNGAGVFDTITVASDLTCTAANSATYLLFYADNSITMRMVQWCFSGTEPSTSQTYIAWYDTTNNLMKYRTNSTTWYSDASLPLAIITVSNGAISSIDQIFNGFGYIGSTIFALPGVKGLIPDGRNSDGTLKNIEITITSVVSITGAWGTFDYQLYITHNSTIDGGLLSQCYYDETKNKNIVHGNEYRGVCFTHIRTSSDKITSLTPKTAFHAVDYNDGEYIANCAMPSDRYVNLTLGSSGASYTAPADGYVVFDKASSGANQYIRMTTSDGLRVLNNSTGSGQYLSVFLPVKKNQQFYVQYTAGGATNSFRFIYANGAQ